MSAMEPYSFVMFKQNNNQQKLLNIMKTIAKSLLLGLSIIGAFLGLLILTAQAANAQSNAGLPVGLDKTAITSVRHAAYIAQNRQTLNVNIEKPAGSSLRVAFIDVTGRVLAYQQLAKQESGVFRLTFNIAQLEDGDYEVRIFGKGVAANYAIKFNAPNNR